jgi:hypothetical protein
MKNIFLNFAIVLFVVALINFPLHLEAQSKYHTHNETISVSGTSSLHDWTEKSTKAEAEATFIIQNDKIAGVSALSFRVPATSLKSEHKGMDNNTYKALKADKYENITFVLTSATVTPVDANTFTIRSKGKLTIAGTTKDTEVIAKAVLHEKGIIVTGSKKLKMTDYKVTPPTAMLGTVKTGNDITIVFSLRFKE